MRLLEKTLTFARSTLAFVAVSLAASLASANPPYTMADLEALRARGSFQELVDHIEDVAPAARTPQWDGLLLEGAKGVLANLSGRSDTLEAFWATETLVRRYPSLRNSRELLAKRAEIGKTAIQACFRARYNDEACLNRGRDFIAVCPNDRELDVAVGKIVRQNQNHHAAVPFFYAAVNGVENSPYCGDEDLRLAVVAGLALPPEWDNAKLARALATQCKLGPDTKKGN
jgi:hypothetical protein